MKHKQIKKVSFMAGYGKRFGIGFALENHLFTIDFLCFWVGVEW